MGWGGGGGKLKREWVYVYTELTHFVAQQKPHITKKLYSKKII